ncbi:MAG: Aspartate/methionine/tyrosine aminotransferase AspB [Treponematales bacterium]
MNALAEELNGRLEGTAAGRLLSARGRRLYFPRGIIAQSAEAKSKAGCANATIGMAVSGGQPLVLRAVAEGLPGLTPAEAVAYAPTAGVEALRKAWLAEIARKNPLVDSSRVSLPAVVPGLTAGLSYMADLFVDEGQTVLSSDPCWDNYTLIFEERAGGRLRGAPFFGPSGRDGSGGLDLAAIAAAIREEAASGQVRAVFNFPNNPSGYSPTAREAEALAEMLREAAEGGSDVLAVCDDAYFGLFYEDEVYPASLFGLFAGLHERVLAVKVDGPIKEDYAWGLRAGFVTFASKGLDGEALAALVTKLMGAIRSSVSCANTPAQSLLLRALGDERTPEDRRLFGETLKRRYQAVKKFLRENPEHPFLKPLPFNSGYFMCFLCKGIRAEALRRELLDRHGVGVIALGEGCLRVAYSGLDEEKIAPVFRTIYDAAGKLGRG